MRHTKVKKSIRMSCEHKDCEQIFVFDLHTDNSGAFICHERYKTQSTAGEQLRHLSCTCRLHTISRLPFLDTSETQKNIKKICIMLQLFLNPISTLFGFALRTGSGLVAPRAILNWHLSIYFRVETFSAFTAISPAELFFFFFNPQRGFSVICIQRNATSIIWNCCNERKHGPLRFILLRRSL